MIKKRRRVIRLSLSLVALLLLAVPSAAKNLVSITHAAAVPPNQKISQWRIVVGFNKGFDIPETIGEAEDPAKNPIKNPGSFYLFDVNAGQRLTITEAFLDLGQFYTAAGKRDLSAGNPAEVEIFVNPKVSLDPTHHYHLYVLNVPFNGSPTDDPQPQSFVEFRKPDQPTLLSFTGADGREDANIYLSGEYAGASGEKFSGSVDTKIEIPIRKVIGERTHTFSFFYDLKASNNPKADPDSMNFGVNWEFPLWRYRGNNLQFPIRRIIWRNAPKIESERDFGNTNFIWESRFRFMSRTYEGKHTTFYFRPFMGHELGANINSPLKEAEHKFLYRLMTGTTLNLIFPIEVTGLNDISFEGSYIRRWPLRREVTFEEDDDGNPQPLRFGKGPHDYVSTKFNVNFTKAFGLTVGYEYGSLPPTYKLVDHKTTIGLTYKVKFDR